MTLDCAATGVDLPTIRLAYMSGPEEDADVIALSTSDNYTATTKDLTTEQYKYDYDMTKGTRYRFSWLIEDKTFTCDNVKEFDWQYIR